MSIEFEIEEIGENVDSAEIGAVLVAEGDVIEAGQSIVEVETEKAVFELECPHAGKIVRIHVAEGDKVKVGARILTIEESTPSPAGEPPKADDAEAIAAKRTESSRAPGDAARPSAATQALMASEPAKPQPSVPSATQAQTDGNSRGPIPAGPATRRLARELGVDLRQVDGSALGGRITREDVQAHVRSVMGNGGRVGGGGTAPTSLPDFSQWGPVERQPMNKLGRTAASRLAIAWQTIPHVTQHDLADITDLEAGRKRYVKQASGDDPKITMTALALKALVTCLKSFPHFNASFDVEHGELVLKRYYHVGVAVDTENGLLVPVIRDVDRKTVIELARELTALAQKSRDRKLDVASMRGGTFTITNLGGIGGTAFTPIVNAPEVAILGMSRARWEQVIVDGNPEIRLMLPLSLSYDHRVINGADGARFLRRLVELLADPFRLIVEQ